MKWLEMIEIRAVNINRDLLQEKLLTLCNEIESMANTAVMKSFCHGRIDTDYSVLLFHEGEIKENGSELGLRLVSALKEIGMVHHCVWDELQCDNGREKKE